MKNLTIFIFVLLFAGCAISTGTYSPPIKNEISDFTIVINKNYDVTWQAIINHLSSTFFSIDNFEKDSGLITVSFGSSNPALFVDCGHFSAQKPDANFQPIRFDGPYIEFLRKYNRGILRGKMNISARKVGRDRTEVRINSRYILTAENEIWSFDSGSSSTISVIHPIHGTDPQRTCRSTNYAEMSILNAVKAIAE